MALYPYQKKVKERILAGQSIILQAPTGAGKTRAALSPFIEGFFDGDSAEFPRKCIYSVPMKVLANQFIAEYEKRAAKYSRKFRSELTTAIQTGDRQDDPKLASNLIFTTIDQTLSNFLNIPYALGKGSANLNAGAIVSSYLVFDEFHLYDPDIMLPTVLAMLQMLKDVTPFIVMTATFSSKMLQRLGDLLGAEVVPNDDRTRFDMEQIGAQVGKDRRFYAVEDDISAETILQHKAKRTICICNTVNAAQDLYRAVKHMLANRGNTKTHVELLHSRFYKADRDKKEDWIREQFSIAQNEYDGQPLILIATQVIEVGVDATCDVMHTQIAPANALLQRAGRCARRANETGKVFVYLPRYEDETPNYTPYVMKGKEEKTPRMLHLCNETWAALRDVQFSGQHMSFRLEQALIDRVHTPVDEQILDDIADFSIKRQETIFKAMQTQDCGYAARLIRHIQNQYVIIHPDPQLDEKLVTNPWHYDGFGLYESTIGGAIKRFEEDGIEDWQIVGATPVENAEGAWEDEETPEIRPKTVYKWQFQFTQAGDAYKWYPAIAVHPSTACYDTELGFRFEASDAESAELTKRPRKQFRPPYSYQRETYVEHIRGLHRAYKTSVRDDEVPNRYFLPLREEVAFIMQRLEQRHQLPTGTLDRTIRALFAAHDLGKLSVGWQKWAHRWQVTVNQFFDHDTHIDPTYMAAHTDYEPTKAQKQAQYKSGKRPHHAGESAIVSLALFGDLTDGNEIIMQAALTAIARHHSASTKSYTPFRFHVEAQRAFREALQEVELPKQFVDAVWWEIESGEVLQDDLVNFDKESVDAILLYFLFVRVLRLADQRSQIHRRPL